MLDVPTVLLAADVVAAPDDLHVEEPNETTVVRRAGLALNSAAYASRSITMSPPNVTCQQRLERRNDALTGPTIPLLGNTSLFPFASEQTFQ